MLPHSEIIAFLATKKPEEAKAFYRDVLGLTLVSTEPQALVFDLRASSLRISILQDFTPPPYTVLGWQVADIRASMRSLTQRGVVFEHFDGLGQDESGVCTFPDGSRVAWFRDPDGNMLSLTQFEP